MWDNIAQAAAVAFQPMMMLLAFGGAVLGTLLGATPGISATLSIALLVPVTFVMPSTAALIFLGGIYCGAIYGGSISGILINVPGTPAAVATMADGYAMTKQGRAGHALGADITASLVGGQVGALALLFGAPLLAAWSLNIRSQEFFWIVLFAMSTIGALGEGSVVKGLLSGAVGLLLGTIGMHPLTGSLRFAFGSTALYQGIPVIVGMVGLFSISQVLVLVEEKGSESQLRIPKIGNMFPGFSSLWKLKGAFLRSSAIGTFVGLLPGAGADIASFIAHSEAKRFSKNKEAFGKGSMEGVVASEAANNAVVGGSMIPMLTLGIPGNAVTAALLGGLLIHGLIPGPRLFEEQADVLYPFIFSLFLANIFFAIAAFSGLKYLARVVLTPRGVLAPVITVLTVVGAFAYRNLPADIWIALALGVFGYILRKWGIPLAPIILGIILGPLAERNLQRVMVVADARQVSLFQFFTESTLTVVLMALSVLSIIYTFIREIRYERRVSQPVHGEADKGTQA